jgi:serine/threonine-protein kinase/endoribonuclease IRE1
MFFYIASDGLKMTSIQNENEFHKTSARLHSVIKNQDNDMILLKYLITSMLDFNPYQRFSTENVLKHPYSWSAKQCCDFIVDIAKVMEIHGNFYSVLNKGSRKVIADDWTKKVSKAVLNEILATRRRYKSQDSDDFNGKSIGSLVRVIRNLYVHARNSIIIGEMGNTDDEFINYWTKRFPFLIKHLFDAKTNFQADINDKENVPQN